MFLNVVVLYTSISCSECAERKSDGIIITNWCINKPKHISLIVINRNIVNLYTLYVPLNACLHRRSIVHTFADLHKSLLYVYIYSIALGLNLVWLACDGNV